MRLTCFLLTLLAIAGGASAQGLSFGGDQDYPTLRLGGFTDLNFFATDEEGEDVTSGFVEGQFVLHFTAALSPRFAYFAEITLSARESEFKAEVERSIVSFSHSDRLKLSLGRYHTPINWWNVAFHHGQWLQTSVARPRMTRFGGDFIPVHFLGLMAEGTFPAGGANLGYTVGLGNGRDEIISRAGDAGDVNDSRAWLVKLSLRPDAAYALQLGASIYRDELELADDSEFDEEILSGYVVWSRETPEFITEYATVEHEDLATGDTWSSDAWYAQLAWRIPTGQQRFKPYVRWEELNIRDEDVVFENVPDRRGGLIGLRFDPTTLVALKLEYRRQTVGDQPWFNGAFFQVALAF